MTNDKIFSFSYVNYVNNKRSILKSKDTYLRVVHENIRPKCTIAESVEIW